MLSIFPKLADYIIFTLAKMDPDTSLASSLHFFIEDVSKIFVLLFVMIYFISLLRAGINTDRIKNYLSGKHKLAGHIMAVVFGAVTPFCSCSSIPLFLGFTSAGIPLGITMSFLITSPMINEVAIILLGSILGFKFLVLYVITGLVAGILGGLFIDAIGAEKYLSDLGRKAYDSDRQNGTAEQVKVTWALRHDFAKTELTGILKRVWKWVFIGVGLGALLHGYVPESFITENLGSGQWWSVPLAVVLGIPLYANASGIIPVAESLLLKGMPVGTTLAFIMSVVAASFPEFVLLKQVMKPQLLIIFFLMLLFFFTVAGWLFNFFF